MSPEFEQLAQLISGVSDGLHREMQDGFNRIDKRFDLMEARVGARQKDRESRATCPRPGKKKERPELGSLRTAYEKADHSHLSRTRARERAKAENISVTH